MACSSSSGRRVAITTERDGWCCTRTPVSSPSRRRQAATENSASAARRSTTLCSSRACWSVRSTGAVSAATTRSPSSAATSGSTSEAVSGTPAMARPAIARASGWAGACDGSVRTPSAGRSRRTISSVGPRPQSSSSSSTSGPVASRLEAGRVEDPFVQGAERERPRPFALGEDQRLAAGDVDVGLVEGCVPVGQDDVLRHLLAGEEVRDQPTVADPVRPDRLPAQLEDHPVDRRGRLEAQHRQPTVVDGPGADQLQGRPLGPWCEGERRRALVEPDGQGRRTDARAGPAARGARRGRAR